MDIKTFIVPGLLLIATVFMIASAATPWLDYNDGQIKYTIIYDCGYGVCTRNSADCSALQATRDADAAFTILGIIVLGVGLITSLVRLCVESCAADGSCAAKTVFITGALGLVCSFFSWVLAFALYDASFCNTRLKDNSGVKIGPQGPLALIGFLVAIGVCVCEFLFGHPFAPASPASSSSPAVASGDSAPAPTNTAPEQQ